MLLWDILEKYRKLSEATPITRHSSSHTTRMFSLIQIGIQQTSILVGQKKARLFSCGRVHTVTVNAPRRLRRCRTLRNQCYFAVQDHGPFILALHTVSEGQSSSACKFPQEASLVKYRTLRAFAAGPSPKLLLHSDALRPQQNNVQESTFALRYSLATLHTHHLSKRPRVSSQSYITLQQPSFLSSLGSPLRTICSISSFWLFCWF